jgi:hypothetical protein
MRIPIFLTVLGHVAAATISLTSLGAAQPLIKFELPVDCAMGRVCFVQNYVDQDPGPGARDFRCGHLAYDGHDGTDIRIPTLIEMRRGVVVVAAAAGVVKATRDGMLDISMREVGRTAIARREAGNSVVIDHGNGWETQYSHLRLGSVLVRPGGRVAAHQPIGLVGHSGAAEFPHVEFVVRFRGRPVDPFTGSIPASGCGKAERSLWTPAARKALAYRAGGLLAAGFASGRPSIDRALAGEYGADSLSVEVRALVFWAASWDLKRGDVERVRLIGPDGRTIANSTSSIQRDKAQWFRFIGRKRPGTAWLRGRYLAEYAVFRRHNGTEMKLYEAVREVELR